MKQAPRRRFCTIGRPLAFAHRGGAAAWPENTVLAFRGAIDAGCDVVETDLRLTRDGALVAFHDERVDRTTNGRGPIAQLTLRELRQLDAAYWFSTDGRSFPFRGQGVCVPTLEDACALSSDLRWNVELKGRDPRLVDVVWKAIERLGLHHRILVAAHFDPLVRRFRRLCARCVATAAGSREVTRFWVTSRLGFSPWLQPPFEALQVPVRYRGLNVADARLLRVAHARGIAVHVWTVNEESEMEALLRLGVDGVMSDHPGRLMRALHAARCSAADQSPRA